jgi:hypothetical protein
MFMGYVRARKRDRHKRNSKLHNLSNLALVQFAEMLMWGQPPKPALSGVEGLSGRAKLDSLIR